MDWTTIGNQLVDILLPVLATFLTGLFTYIGTKLKSAYEKKVNTETAKAVVEDVVKFVEQVYTDIHGKEKLQKAIEQASIILQNKGISISEAEINMLIESAVYGLNEGLNTEQKEALKEITDETNKENTTDTDVTEEIADDTAIDALED